MKNYIRKKLMEAINDFANKELIIMRGVPSSGKSTKANQLKGEHGVIFSTDEVLNSWGDYRQIFNDMKEKNDFSKLHAAHNKNLEMAKAAMDDGISPVIIDNINLSPKEFKKYVEYGLTKGYKPRIVNVGTGGLSAEELAKRNQHGVPLDKIKQMIDRYNQFGELKIEDLLNNEKTK